MPVIENWLTHRAVWLPSCNQLDQYAKVRESEGGPQIDLRLKLLQTFENTLSFSSLLFSSIDRHCNLNNGKTIFYIFLFFLA